MAERKEYLLLRWPKQNGKTTLLLNLNELLKDSDYLTLEDPG